MTPPPAPRPAWPRVSGTASPAATPPADLSAPPRLATAGPRVARLARLLAQATPAEHTVLTAEFWSRVEREGTPLVESSDDPRHRTVTFLWRGHRATRQVLLFANGLPDHDHRDGSLLTRLPGTEIWYLTRRLRTDHRGSYRLVADVSPGPVPTAPQPFRARLRGLAAHAAPDPYNRTPLPGRAGSPGSSLYELPMAPAQPWRDPWPGIPRGTVERHRGPGSGLADEPGVQVYVPPSGTATGPLDVLVLPDGDMWFGALGLAHTLDALLAERMIPPLLVLAPDASGPGPGRHEHETGPARDSYADFLADALLPWAAARLPLTTDPRRTAVAGQHLGATTALHTCLRRPDRFGSALVQSPAPWPPADPPPDPAEPAPGAPSWPARWFAPPHRSSVRIHLDLGLREPAAEPGRALGELLFRCGHTVTCREFNGGPDYACWRGGLADGLVALFGR